mmetsp:Transcript_6270/g.14149  ORF Transcript_6270/g.14149 Transcript_6270/m.14149 type:complete len:122 (-) Transcript_6270:428-793(-)
MFICTLLFPSVNDAFKRIRFLLQLGQERGKCLSIDGALTHSTEMNYWQALTPHIFLLLAIHCFICWSDQRLPTLGAQQFVAPSPQTMNECRLSPTHVESLPLSQLGLGIIKFGCNMVPSVQ